MIRQLTITITIAAIFFMPFAILAQEAEPPEEEPVAEEEATAPTTPTKTESRNPIDYFDKEKTLASGSGLPQDDPESIVMNIIKAFLQLIGIIDLVLIIYGGFIIMTGGAASGGEGGSAGIKKGKDIILWAFVGAAIILSSLGILEYIDRFI